MVPFDDKGFLEAMEHEVKQWLLSRVKEGRFASYDGSMIQTYYAMRPDAVGTIVMVHGFCEFFGRYYETAYDFYEEGYNIFFIEQRGHGNSERYAPKDLVHVDDFDEYVEDLKYMMDNVVLVTEPNLKKFLYCHSMGGAVGTLFLEQYPEYFSGAILSSPMLKMNYGQIRTWQAEVLQKVSKALRWNVTPMPGAEPFDGEHPDFEGSGMLSQARYTYQFELRKNSAGAYTTNSGTYGWVRAAMDATEELRERAGVIKIPVLILQAGRDNMVDNEGQNEVCRKIKSCELRRFPESKHEIYGATEEILRKYYRVIFAFLRNHCQ